MPIFAKRHLSLIHYMQKIPSASNYRQELRRKILSAAMQDFRKRGVKAVKMDDVASQLSISKRTLYELYHNKEDLLYECLCDHDAFLEQRLKSSLSADATVMDVLISFMRLHVEESSKTNPQFFSDLGKYPKVMKYIEERNERSRQRAIGFMFRGVEEGYFRSDVNYSIINLMAEVFMKYVMDHELYKQFPLPEIFRNVILVILRGFCTEKGLRLIDNFDFSPET